MPNALQSAIKDNQSRGKVGDFLKDCMKDRWFQTFFSGIR